MSARISRTGELILQGRPNDSHLPSTLLSYNKTLSSLPQLILEQIDFKDELSSHPLKPRCNCPPFAPRWEFTPLPPHLWFFFYVSDVVVNHTQPFFMPSLIDTHGNCTVNFGDFWHGCL